MADPISLAVVVGVTASVVVAGECRQAYKRRQARKRVEGQLGLTPEQKKAYKRLRKERGRIRKEREKEYKKRLKDNRRRGIEAIDRTDSLDVACLRLGVGQERELVSEMNREPELPEYSARPRNGIDSAVRIENVSSSKKESIKALFKSGEQKKWLRKFGGRSGREAAPPPYEEVVA